LSLHSKLRWRAKLPESTARETSHLIAMVLNMHLDHDASCDRSLVLINTVMHTNVLLGSNRLLPSNDLMYPYLVVPIYPSTSQKDQPGQDPEPAIQVVFHWQRFNQKRCQVEILSSSEGPFLDPWSLTIAHRLRQILNEPAEDR
jgi:hypothetical protein